MASAAMTRHVALTGPPGIGKTTLINKTCQALRNAGIPVQGFYTEELRVNGRRSGFDVVTLDGNRGPLARVSENSLPSGRREYRVGQYVVNLQGFEQTALPVLRRKAGDKPCVVVIDEVGKMEMFSSSFVQAVRGLLTQTGATVLTTIPVTKGRPIALVEEIRTQPDVKLFTVTRDNRDAVVEDIVRITTQCYRQSQQ